MMQTLFSRYAGSLIRHGLTLLAGVLIAHGVSNNDDLMKLVGDLTPVLVSVGWSLVSKYTTHQDLQSAVAAASEPVGIGAATSPGPGPSAHSANR